MNFDPILDAFEEEVSKAKTMLEDEIESRNREIGGTRLGIPSELILEANALDQEIIRRRNMTAHERISLTLSIREMRRTGQHQTPNPGSKNPDSPRP